MRQQVQVRAKPWVENGMVQSFTENCYTLRACEQEIQIRNTQTNKNNS